MNKKKVTAAELMAKLNADPEYVAKRAREEAERNRRAAEWRAAEVPLLDELRAAGWKLESVWDLVNARNTYAPVLPILLEHLRRPYPARVREGIARAMAMPEARFAWDELARLFQEERQEDARDGLAVALAAATDETRIEDLIELTRDRRSGPSRLLLLRALERSRRPEALKALRDLEADPDLQKEVGLILARLRGRRT